MAVAAKSRLAFAAYHHKVKEGFFDPHMNTLLSVHGREYLAEELETYGKISGHTINELAMTSNHITMMPRLEPYDRFGNRIEKIVFPEEYHKIGRLAYGSKVMQKYNTKGKEFDTLALHYLLAQNGEAGHCCPMACTAGLIKSLQQEDASSSPIVSEWLAKLTNPDYNNHYHGSQFMTEVQGGSDVGANTLKAVPSTKMNGWYELHGEKWFCSVADAHLWLVVARPEGSHDGTKGLRGFVVPRHTPDNNLNTFRIRRLKDKLGTRTMASGEIDFEGTLAYPLKGDFRNVLETVINTSRLYNAVSCTGIMQRCYAEAHAYAQHREAFGNPILSIPSVAVDVVSLKTSVYGARSVTFFLSAMADKAVTTGLNKEEHSAMRMLVNMNKYWTAAACIQSCHTAIDVMGGNGAIEEFSAMPRMLRDSVVCAQWEGPHNTLCSQVLRDSQRLGLHKPMFSFLKSLCVSPLPRLDELEVSWNHLLAQPDGLATLSIRSLVDELCFLVQYILLKSEKNLESSRVADHLFIVSALGWSPIADKGYASRLAGIIGSPAESKL